ncbi:hypothetical protein [Streptomyces griseus]|uniref:hypothetical protein n=1 Tax=Streptomyces griseus TaxID=1911 RepID=UPI0037AD2821
MHAWGPASGFWTSGTPGDLGANSSCSPSAPRRPAGTIASPSALVGFGLDSVIAVKEGRDAWRGKGCRTPAAGPDGCGR